MSSIQPSRSSSSSSSSDESGESGSVATKPKRQKPTWQANVSEDWLTKVVQTRKYNLVLNGMQFCKSWTLPDCIRDLIQNATDSMYAVHKKVHTCKKPRVVIDSPPDSWDETTKIVTKIYLECEKGGRTDSPVGYLLWSPQGTIKNANGPVITIINLGANFTSNALTVGVSNKKKGDAGGHGEGLKAAITVAIRANSAFEIFQSGVAIKFKKGDSRVVYKVTSPIHRTLEFKPLTKEVTKKLGVSVQHDVIVHFGDTQNLTFGDYQEAVEHFLFLTHRHPSSSEIGDFPIVNRKETKSGRAILLGEEFAGKVYAVGIYFKTFPGAQRAYGVDFIKEDALCRDRNEVSERSYLKGMANVVSEVLEDDPGFADVILDEFKEAERSPQVVEHLNMLPRFASSQAKISLIEAYKKKPENSAVTYIVSGTSAKDLTNNPLVPQWCDLQACKVVTPVLFALISEGFPSIEVIKRETSMKLKACPTFDEGSREICTWLQEKEEFFDPEQLQRVIGHIEVKKTDNMLDVPFYIIEGNKIVFSERALKLKHDDPRKFLDIASNAIKEAAVLDPRKPDAVQDEPQPPRAPEAELPSSYSEEENSEESSSSSDSERKPIRNIPPKPQSPGREFTSDFAVPHNMDNGWKIPDDDAAIIAKLETSLTDTISFGEHSILCTPEVKSEWNRLIVEKKEDLEALTNRAIQACAKALETLGGPNSCPLSFYISRESVLGYAKANAGLHINLRSVLLEVSKDNQVEESALKAYFDVLMSHEYAHHVHLADGHAPEHGRRTEWNMQTLLEAAYKSSKSVKLILRTAK